MYGIVLILLGLACIGYAVYDYRKKHKTKTTAGLVVMALVMVGMGVAVYLLV